MVRVCCIRSFGHFVARLQGSILQFNPEVGIFVSIAQSEQESLLQQAQAQFRMVSRPSSPGSLRNQASGPRTWWSSPEEVGAGERKPRAGTEAVRLRAFAQTDLG